MTESERIDVVVIDDHPSFREWITDQLERSRQLRSVGAVARIADLRSAGFQFDVCILDLIGVGQPDEVRTLLEGFPVVVCTQADGWRHLVSAWACGAAGVLGKHTSWEIVEDAVVDAERHRPWLRPQLAGALIQAIDVHQVAVPPYFAALLDRVSGNQRTRRALADLGVPEQAYAEDIERLRADLARTSLGELRIPRFADAADAEASVEPVSEPAEARRLTVTERKVMALYADGFTYTEIGKELSISGYTLRSHVKNALEKLGLRDTHPQTRLIAALFLAGRHRRPDQLRRRLAVQQAEEDATLTARKQAQMPTKKFYYPDPDHLPD
jgi:DNA-binding NarL/FixJ family response regulator